jgi:Protein of unknown function (DUF664)
MASMQISELLVELYGRVPPLAAAAVDGLDQALLTQAPDPGANTVAWLVWHATRVQDHHVSELLDEPQLWVSDGWADRLDLEPDPHNTGYGHTSDDVASIRPRDARLLVDYLDAVHRRTIAMLEQLGPDDLDRVVDRRWDPPVTLGVRLVSIADDDLQHVGQAAYLRGLLSS